MDHIGIILSVIGILLAVPIGIWIGRRDRKRPDLRSAKDFDALISPGDWLLRGDLDIAFDGRKLDRVSRTYLALWNHSGDTVRAADVLPSDPLRIVVGNDDEIFQTRLVSSSRPQIGARVAVTPLGAPVTFDFLDPKDGFIIEVMHRGEAAAAFAGTVPGAAIRDPKSLILSAESLSYLRLPPVKRVRQMFRDRAYFLTALLMITGGSIVSVISLVESVLQMGRAALVPAEDFDLTSLAGQRDFAKAVRDVGEIDFLNLAFEVVLVVAAFGFLLSLLNAFRARVPRTIAAEIASESEAPSDDAALGDQPV
jgi:hypothetical protein